MHGCGFDDNWASLNWYTVNVVNAFQIGNLYCHAATPTKLGTFLLEIWTDFTGAVNCLTLVLLRYKPTVFWASFSKKAIADRKQGD